MARNINYECTECQKQVPRDQLTAKKIEFYELGEGGKLLRSRTVAWLCQDCRDTDNIWNRPAQVRAPGNSDIKTSEVFFVPSA